MYIVIDLETLPGADLAPFQDYYDRKKAEGGRPLLPATQQKKSALEPWKTGEITCVSWCFSDGEGEFSEVSGIQRSPDRDQGHFLSAVFEDITDDGRKFWRQYHMDALPDDWAASLITVGWNVHFDLQHLRAAAVKEGLRIPWQVSAKKYSSLSLDIMDMVAPFTSLWWVCQHLGLEYKDATSEELFDWYREHNSELLDRNVRDVELTTKVWDLVRKANVTLSR